MTNDLYIVQTTRPEQTDRSDDHSHGSMWKDTSWGNKMPFGVAEMRRIAERKEVLFEGMRLRLLENDQLVEGASYLAARNKAPQLLTVRHIDHDNMWVVPKESAYVFDITECIPVEIVLD